MWRRRDHERYIGGYDPEYEMPDPDRRPGQRYASDASRHNSRDTRFAYRWDPDRIEDRYGARQPRDFRDVRTAYDQGYDDSRLNRGYRPPSWGWTDDDRDYNRDPDREFNRRPDPRFDYDRDDRYRY